ncbi:MAG TPA: glutamate synthase subunit beta [Dehalococcoidia bacterium]|nr:glutamate synthase subunit beta [Dehalococcoidia bacterium]
MGEPTGFKDTPRKPLPRRPVGERVRDYQEFLLDWTEEDARKQGGRCMDCGIPFCHRGCPLGNLIPEWNDFVYRGQWRRALAALHATNNFPEFTGRICPAPCEASCTLSINQDPVTIEYIEKTIADRGWKEGWIKAEPPAVRTGKRVAVVGSGPAGLAAAQQLNRAGHTVTVFERDSYIGGLLRLGIPDFKLEKHVVQRRVDQMAEEGVIFRTNTYVGRNYPVEELKSSFDAIVLAGGSTVPRDLPVPGRELRGVHFAMEYLTQQNRVIAGEYIPPEERIHAEGKRVVILGGGDTGADCLGTAHRQGAEIVRQFELLSEPPRTRAFTNPWPQWPVILRSSAAHDEGGIRDYDISTTHFSGSNGHVEKLHAVRVAWERDESGRMNMTPIPGSEFEVDADLVLLAMGFLHPEHAGLLQDLGVELDGRGNVKLDANRMTSVPGIFAAGDMARGQSLVVWALAEGRETAYFVDKYLMGESELPRPYLMPPP